MEQKNRVKNISKRLHYIEPNDVYGHIDGQPVTPDYTDFCIYFNLIAEKISRVKGGSLGESMLKEKIMATWRSQMNSDENYVKYVDGSTIGGKNFLTNFESDIHFNDLKDGKVVEGLGVSSVSINFEAYFTPTITIKFIDTRGSGLFGYEEIEHGTKDGTISQDTLFGAFFTFPYPKFTLIVKGFYGRPVSYQLTCSDFRASFNSETGNFETTVSFIGYQYSLLTDIPMSFLVTAPYCEYIGKPYWDKHVSDPDWAMDNGSQPIKLKELIENIDKAIENSDFTEEVTVDSSETFSINESMINRERDLVTISEYEDMLNEIKNLYISVYNDENGNQQVIENFVEDDLDNKILFIQTPYNLRNGVEAKGKKHYNIDDPNFLESVNNDMERLREESETGIKNTVREELIRASFPNINFLDCQYFTKFMDRFEKKYFNELDEFKNNYPCNYKNDVSNGSFPNGTETNVRVNIKGNKEIINTKINPENNQILCTFSDSNKGVIIYNGVFNKPIEIDLIFNKEGKKEMISQSLLSKLNKKFLEIYNFFEKNLDLYGYYQNPNNFFKDCRFLLYDENGFKSLLLSRVGLTNEDINDIETRQNNIIYKDVRDILETDFFPYIGNIFKIIMCHLETFTEMIFECADKISEQILSGERYCEKLGIKIEDTDVAKNLDRNVPAFPELYNSGIKSDKGDIGLIDNNFKFVAWPGDFKKENWEEAKLVESIVKGVKTTYYNIDFEPINYEEEKEFKINNFPIFNFDIDNQETFPEYIFKKNNIFSDKNINPLSNLAGYLGLRASSALFILEKNEKLMFELGKLESIRLLHQLKTSENVKKYFEGEFQEDVLSLSEKMQFFTFKDSINRETINEYEYNIKDRSALYSKDGESNGRNYEYITTLADVIIDNNEINIDAPIIPCNFSSISDIKKNVFKYDGNSYKNLKGKKIDFFRNNEIVVDNSLNNCNVYAEYEGKTYKEGEYINVAMFKPYIGGIYGNGVSFAKSFYEYMNNFDKENYKYNNISFGDLKTIKKEFYQENIHHNESYLLYPRYDTTNGDNRLPVKIDEELVEENNNTNDWTNYLKEKLYSGKRLERSYFMGKNLLSNTVFKDFLTTNSLTDNSDKHSLFLDDSYYYFNKYNEDKFVAEASKAFLFLHSTFNDNPLSIFKDKVKMDGIYPNYIETKITPFELTTYNDLLFYGGVSWFYENRNNLPEDLFFSRSTCITRKNNSFVLYKDFDSPFFVTDTMFTYYNLDDFSVVKIPNVRHQLALIFKLFVLNEWPSIRDICELKYREKGEIKNFNNEIKISLFLEQLNILSNTREEKWEILSGKKSFYPTKTNLENPGYLFLENFVGSYRDIHERMLLLDEYGDKVKPIQEDFKNSYAEGVLIGTCYNKYLNTYNIPSETDTVSPFMATLTLKDRDLEYKSFFDGFFNGVKQILKNNVEIEENVSEEDIDNFESKETRDFYIPVYTYLKNLWDKWLSIAYIDREGNSKNNAYSVKNFFGNFIFIDQFYVNLYKKLHINCEILSRVYNNNEWKMSIYKFINDIAKEHNCIIYSMADLPDLGSQNAEENLADIFKPVPYNEIKENELRNNNHFVVVFTYTFCDKLSNNDKEFVNNGFDIYGFNDGKNIVPTVFDEDGNYDEEKEKYKKEKNKEDYNLFEQRTRYGYNVPSFGVAFSRQNNAIFKKIDVGMQNPTATEQSLMALSDILNKAKGNDKKVCFYGQDLYPVYNNVSYNCNVEMMGDVQIAQLMYFQLLNVPMFRGAYQIFNVSHEITPGNIVTRFKGMKMADRATPFPIAWYMDLYITSNGDLLINEPMDNLNYVNPYTIDESYELVETQTIYNGTRQPVINNDPMENDFWEYRYKKDGYSKNYNHTGIDVKVKLKTPVLCVWDGTIEFARPYGKGGQTVKIIHENGYNTYYMHLINFNESVVRRKNKKIKAGECIGWTGGENCKRREIFEKFKGKNDEEKCINCQKVFGSSSGPHLHFEIRKRKNGKEIPVDPVRLGINFGNNNLGFSKYDNRNA